ncbi:MAG TPA: Ig-like domain-containing protein [Gemmatimonadaceae bacterium]|nr:Ig-like domain-containing protein [Gemmatimonadaceae bacterium]
MKHRTLNWAKAATRTWRQWRAPAALAALALLFACLKGRSPTDGNANDVRLSINAQVVTTTASQLHISIFYLDQGPTPVVLVDKTISTASGTTRLPLTIDLSRCLDDPRRVSTGDDCALIISVALVQNGTVVDSVTLPAVIAVPGQVINVTPTITVSAIGSVVVAPGTDTVGVGSQVQLTDTVRDVNGTVLPGHTVVWASADSTIARVDSIGNVTGVKIGTTQVTASAGGQLGTSVITVIAASGLTLGTPIVTFSAPNGGQIPTNALITVTSTDTTIVSGLTAAITYSGQTTGWLAANVSDSGFGSRVHPVPHGLELGARAARRSVRAQTAGVTTPATLDIVPTTTSLADGQYTATVVVTGNGGASASLNVTYTISSGAIIAVSPTAVVDTATQGAGPTTKTVAITNGGTGTLSGLSVSTQYGSGATGWISTSLNTTTAPATLSVTVTPGSLAGGTYTAGLTVSSSVAGVSPQTVAVQLDLSGGPSMGFSANPLTFTQYGNGTTPAAAQTTTVINTGSGALGTVAGGTVVYGSGATNWLTLGLSGTTITAQPSTTAVPLGSFSATASYTATNAKNSPQTLTINLTSAVTFTKIATGSAFACGLTTGGTVFCWGDNTYGEHGIGTTNSGSYLPTYVPVPTTTGQSVTDVVAGQYHVCALITGGKAYCWGKNDRGQLGIGSTTSPITSPTAITTTTFSQISAGGMHTCGIESGGAQNYVACWGDNTSGQIGNGSVDATAHTTPVINGNSYAYVSAGYNHTCVLTSTTSGSILCWGDNTSGELGDGHTLAGGTGFAVSVTLGALAPVNAKAISAGYQTTCAIDVNGGVWCWGYNNYGELGLGTASTIPDSVPAQIPSLTLTAISVGYITTCGSGATGAYCWGSNDFGQLGDGTLGGTADSPAPVQGTAGATVGSIATASYSGAFTCFVVSSTSIAYCTGQDANQQLGIPNNTSPIGTPAQVFGQPAGAGVTPARVGPRPKVARLPSRTPR